jgi:hypothetical protein
MRITAASNVKPTNGEVNPSYSFTKVFTNIAHDNQCIR